MKYVVHCKKEKFDVFVGRGSIWGNPYSHLKNSSAPFLVSSRLVAIREYANWVVTDEYLAPRIKNLREKVLGCWCDPEPCHAHVLAMLANDDYEHPKWMDNL